MVMFDVHHVLLREDKEKEKYNLEKLIEFNAGTNRRVKPFKTWFDCSHSKVWQPMQLPPVLASRDTTSCNDEIVITDHEEHVNLDWKLSNKSMCISEKSEHDDVQSISPLMKKYLNKKDSKTCDTRLSLTKVKWCSSFTNTSKVSTERKKLSECEQSMVKRLKEKALSCLFGSNIRGKWIIQESSMIDGYSLDDLWSRLLEELCDNSFQTCNITFQTDPDHIFIYTNFLLSAMVATMFTSIKKMVRKMSYVVHSYGKVLSWNGEEIEIV